MDPYTQKLCASSSCNGSSKRRKVDDGFAQSSSSHTVNQVDDQGMARPPGVKASKGKGKRSVSKTSRVESQDTSLLEFQSMWAIKEKDLAMKERLSKMRILTRLIAITKPLSETEVAVKNKLINEMLSNFGE